ncbi:MAG TPA: hypothetical protein VN673_07575 [Clostridia bacterium]|nr:hypothetical protein [Clostridia bacterium]
MKRLDFLNRPVPKWISRTVLLAGGALVLLYGYRHFLPAFRLGYHSELVMLGDFKADHRWSRADLKLLQPVMADPFAHTARDCFKADLNQNGRLDAEDVLILEQLSASEEPYAAEAKAIAAGRVFPRPRELYRYVSPRYYLSRPLYALPYAEASNSALACLSRPTVPPQDSPYAQQLWAEIYDEAVRFDLAYRARAAGLTPAETAYVGSKLVLCNQLYAEAKPYELLLELIALVEDAETLTTRGQDPFVAKTLFLRDHLRDLLLSPQYAEFEAGRVPVQQIFKAIEAYLKQDLGLEMELEKLGPPRELSKLQNYINRTEWQYYKTSAQTEKLAQLVNFAQHDRRYLRAVARTSRVHTDPGVQNHNLPMVLLFREALRITGNKKAAVGLLDESIRIPFFWVKSIPKNKLPSSVALENFLLPGNKEDGADKSRHWNVFGGICLYKSAPESLELALKREMKDLRDGGFSKENMKEFIRDTIANLNGIYHVVSMDPALLRRPIKAP